MGTTHGSPRQARERAAEPRTQRSMRAPIVEPQKRGAWLLSCAWVVPNRRVPTRRMPRQVIACGGKF
jgi:hypothetical protein